MKTATLPPIRVEPKLRREAEKLLRPGETLSAFLTESFRRSVSIRKEQAEFLALAEKRSRAEGKLVPAEEVLAKLERKYGRR